MVRKFLADLMRLQKGLEDRLAVVREAGFHMIKKGPGMAAVAVGF